MVQLDQLINIFTLITIEAENNNIESMLQICDRQALPLAEQIDYSIGFLVNSHTSELREFMKNCRSIILLADGDEKNITEAYMHTIMQELSPLEEEKKYLFNIVTEDKTAENLLSYVTNKNKEFNATRLE